MRNSHLHWPAGPLLALALGCVLAAPAYAEDSLRCGSRIVSTGDGMDKVRALCGDPTDVALRGVVRRRSYGRYASDDDFPYFGASWLELPVEVWTYNLGPHKLLRKLRFIGDELVEIRTDGHGY